MYIPDIPTWCWNLTGENEQFFSQPTIARHEGDVRWFTGRDDPCVARCTEATWSSWAHEPQQRTGLIQCGQVAALDAQGRFLCEYHWHCAWECHACGTFLPQGAGGFCSEACELPLVSPLDCEP